MGVSTECQVCGLEIMLQIPFQSVEFNGFYRMSGLHRREFCIIFAGFWEFCIMSTILQKSWPKLALALPGLTLPGLKLPKSADRN
jgi:hypothetical protein